MFINILTSILVCLLVFITALAIDYIVTFIRAYKRHKDLMERVEQIIQERDTLNDEINW